MGKIGEMNSLIALRDENIFDSLKYIHVPTAIFHRKEDKICPLPTFYDVKDEFNRTLIKFLNY